MKARDDYRHAFAIELRKAMTARNVTIRALADAIGISYRQVWFWTDGRSLPYMVSGVKIAEALDWPNLAAIVRSARTVKCAGCGAKVVSEGSGSLRLYCKEACRYLAIKLERTPKKSSRASTQLGLYATSVGAMCNACEPLGVCQDGGCPLRIVSPFPLARGLVMVPLAVDGRKNRWDHPEERAKASEAMKAVWASRDASQRRENTRAANVKRWSSYTPEERVAISAKISAGIKASRPTR